MIRSRTCAALAAIVALAGLMSMTTSAGDLPAIKSVAIGSNREFRVNGQPFLPIMGWLQGPENLPKLKAIGINTIAGYWRPKDGSPGAGGGAHGYDKLARKAGLYFVPPFEAQFPEEMTALAASENVLCWIHRDEPDMPKIIRDTDITVAKHMFTNEGRPLELMLDGKAETSAVVDPMIGAEITIKLPESVTVKVLAVTSFIAPNLKVARNIVMIGDDKEILRAELNRGTAQQKFELEEAATFKTLVVKVLTAYLPTEFTDGGTTAKWGALAEIEGFDATGNNILKAGTRKVTRETADQVMARYKAQKKLDPGRPMMMTVTPFFISDKYFDTRWTKAQSDLIYPELLEAADIPGHDVYPIMLWNQPEKLTWISQGVDELRGYAGRDKPTYVWLESLKGARFGDKAHPVTGLTIRNQVYQAIIKGATVIGYFTHRFGENSAEFGVTPENQKAILEINTQLQRLAPAILSPDTPEQPTIAIEGDLAAQCLAKNAPDDIVIFAQNIDMKRRAGKAVLRCKGLRKGTRIEVVDEGRTITAGDGTFTDQFDALAVHVYRVGK